MELIKILIPTTLIIVALLLNRCPDEIIDEMKITPPTGGAGWFDVLQGTTEESQGLIVELRKQICR